MKAADNAKSDARGVTQATGDSAAAGKAYRRARTDEQKGERLADILDATERLLDAGSYRDITMSSIAAQLGYSRANLAHYVGSKEEILLLLYVRSLQGMLRELDGMEAAAASEPAAALAATVARHRDFGRIGALLSSLVETNVSLERLVRCKTQIVEMMAQAAELLVRLGLFEQPGQATEFLLDLASYAAGLYPSAHPLPIQVEASKAVGYPLPDYEESLARHIAVQLAGYRALG